jgi:hypothetical protein
MVEKTAHRQVRLITTNKMFLTNHHEHHSKKHITLNRRRWLLA